MITIMNSNRPKYAYRRSNPQRTLSTPTRGFTLIELIIVVTILVILSVGVVPIFNGSFATIQADHSIRDFAATVRFAQERAVTDGVEFRLYLNPDLNSYGIEKLSKMDGEDKVFVPVPIQQLEKVQLPIRLTLKTPRAKKDSRRGEYYVAFYPSGACDDARINISNTDGKMFYIDTKGGIGRLKVTK